MRCGVLQPAVRLALLSVLAAQLFGCGYSTSSLYNPDIRSVAIDVFTNDTFRRDLELDLTREVARQVRMRTPWRVENRSRADAAVTGRIINVAENVLSEDPNDLVLESSVVVTAEAVLTSLATGEVLKRVTRTSSVPFLIPRNESRSTALSRSLRELAEDLIQGFERWK